LLLKSGERDLNPRGRPEAKNISGGDIFNDGRRLLVSKGSDSDRGEQIATE